MEEKLISSHFSPSDEDFTSDTDINVDAILEQIKSEMPEKAAIPDAPPGTVRLDEDVVLQMVVAVQELTREVRQLRAEIGGKSCHEPQSTPTEKGGKSVQVTTTKKKGSKTASVISNVLFYAMLVALVLGAFLIKSNSTGGPFTFAGYAGFTVLTSSMEDVYPKGSLVITKSVDANELEIGDDITFMVSESSSVTHRIIAITENFQNTGARAFETQGVMNENPDKDLVAAANIVGQVIFCSVFLGQAAAFVSKNWPFLLFFVVVIAGLVVFLKWNMSRPDHKAEKTREQASASAEREENKSQ